MYLSRIALDHNRRETMDALALPNHMHGAVERCFPGEKQRVLWRVDWLDNVCYLLMLSARQPDFAPIAAHLATTMPGVSKCYDPFLSRLRAGQSWRFRLCANPVHSSLQERKSPDARGKILAYVRSPEQKQWLIRRGEGFGFTLTGADFDTVHSQWLRFPKGRDRREVTLLRVTFEGVLRVTDEALLCQALLGGIGREKAYGCGLLTLAQARV